jgi:hypothetical protein
MRLEVYNEAGQKVLDTELHGGSVLDWHLLSGAGERVAEGAYLCVLTVKSLSGRLSQKLGTVTVGVQTAAVQSTAPAQLNRVQAQAVGPLEADAADAALVVLSVDAGEAATVLTHNGKDGQLSRTRGVLTFRVGDFFSGADKEQMRLTEDGNLGLGTAKPKARLDVAGMIRAREGFQFVDGSTLNVNDKGALTLTSSTGNVVPNVAGTGTQNRLAKWTDDSGTLGDSFVSETGGTGLQLTAPPNPAVDTNLLYLDSTNGTTGVLAGNIPSFGAANGPFFAMRGNTYTTIANQRGLFTIAAGNVSNPQGDAGSVKFNTGNDLLRMVIRPSGNVGIGTPTPSAVLNVVGPQPPPASSNNGAEGTPVLQVVGGKGQDATGNAFAGRGSSVSIQGGNGGNGAPFPGNGGSITLQPGLGGGGGLGSPGNVLLAPSGGKVAIGLTASAALLHIAANSGQILMGDAGCSSGFAGIGFANNMFGCGNYSFLGNGIDTVVNSPSGNLFFRTGGDTDRMAIAANGNVGIGTTSTTAKLQVGSGDIAITTQSKGLILRATDGTNCYRITVNNAGTLNAAAVTCP